MSECELVPRPGRCQGKNRGVAGRVQRRTAPQQSGLPNAKRVCRRAEILSYDWLRKSRQVKGSHNTALSTADAVLLDNSRFRYRPYPQTFQRCLALATSRVG